MVKTFEKLTGGPVAITWYMWSTSSPSELGASPLCWIEVESILGSDSAVVFPPLLVASSSVVCVDRILAAVTISVSLMSSCACVFPSAKADSLFPMSPIWILGDGGGWDRHLFPLLRLCWVNNFLYQCAIF